MSGTAPSTPTSHRGKAALLSVGEQVDTRTASGRMVLNIMATISQWEREAGGERTAVAMQHKAASGEYPGGKAKYGFRVSDDGVRLAPVEAEQAVLAVARELRAAGMSLRAIARKLDERGHRSRLGRPFASVQIRRMVRATLATCPPGASDAGAKAGRRSRGKSAHG